MDVALATTLPRDAVNGALGDGSSSVAVVGVVGALDEAISLSAGRLPGSDEVVLSRQSMELLGLAQPIGYLEAADGRQWSIVGSFSARTPFEDLEAMALTVPDPARDGVAPGNAPHQLRVVADEVTNANAVQHATLAIVAPDPSVTQVTTATALGASAQAATGALASFGRSLLVLILGAGALFVAAVVLADVLIHRRDLGRRRTLGVTRGDLVALVVARTTVAAAMGGAIGVVAGLALTAGAGDPPVAFGAAVAVLAVLTAMLACLPPAVFAARRDPVEVMRTP